VLTLRQIEVIRAIMTTGTMAGAAAVLNVSTPGISRLVKHAGSSLGIRLFVRHRGRYVPTPEARAMFAQIDEVYQKIEDLRFVIGRIGRGERFSLDVGSTPSIGQHMVPTAVKRLRDRYPDLSLGVDILKIEEVRDYLLLGRGELVAMSSRFDHPSIAFAELAVGELLCIVPREHPLAARDRISIAEIAHHPLVGIEPRDPYGRIIARAFESNGLPFRISVRARFGQTVCALVQSGAGIAVIDEFSIAGGTYPGLRGIRLAEPTRFQTYVATRSDAPLSLFGNELIGLLRRAMRKQPELTLG
jgi:DNA-binding transcriptional LysR family regulator